MSKSLEAERSNHSVKLSIENYLVAVNKTSERECFADLMYFLLDTFDFKAEIESKIIDITRLMAVLASTKVNNAIADELGNTFLSNVSHFLADMTKTMMYMRDSKGCMAALDLAYWEHATDAPDGFLTRVKKEYELKLIRLKDGEDFE
jgi:hypothetical protein